MFKLDKVLELLAAVGPVVAGMSEFKQIFDQIVATFKKGDQSTLRDAYQDLMADNDEGHARLQEKLAKAAQK
jgi:hypothetical protein